MHRKGLFVLLSLFITGCVTQPIPKTTPTSLTETQAEMVKIGIKIVLKDPDSATFGPFIAAKAESGEIGVCGHVNAKNSFGGYTGMSPFIGTLRTNNMFKVAQIGNNREDSEIIKTVCRKMGIQIY